MDYLARFVQRITGGTEEIKTPQLQKIAVLVVIGLIGILLLVISFSPRLSGPSVYETGSGLTRQDKALAMGGVGGINLVEDEARLERSLAEILSQVHGAGRVSVKITFETGRMYDYAENETYEESCLFNIVTECSFPQGSIRFLSALSVFDPFLPSNNRDECRKRKVDAMYAIHWDTNTGGILLSDSKGCGIGSEIRPVFFEELDLLGFNHNRKTVLCSKLPSFVHIFNNTWSAWDNIKAALCHNLLGQGFTSYTAHGIIVRPNELNSMGRTNLSKIRVLCQKSITRVDCVRTRHKGCTDYVSDIEVAVYSGPRPDAIGFVSHSYRKGIPVRFGVQGNALDAKLFCSPDDPLSNLASICYNYLFDREVGHNIPPAFRRGFAYTVSRMKRG
jgi:hypothetical protein